MNTCAKTFRRNVEKRGPTFEIRATIDLKLTAYMVAQYGRENTMERCGQVLGSYFRHIVAA